jgi:transcriptional regulator with XRE-family HTH domain
VRRGQFDDKLDDKVGPLLREWRGRRRLSQLELATRAGTSARHLSFVETGRARPSRDLLLRLADHLEVPPRRRNALLLAAGYAPVYGPVLPVEPRTDAVHRAIELLVQGREPCPTFVVDRAKNVVLANRSTQLLLDGVCATLLRRPMNIVRLALHPKGIIRRATNPAEWRATLLRRLSHEVLATGDERLGRLYEEVAGYGGGTPEEDHAEAADHIMAPLWIVAFDTELSFINVVTTFGTPVDAVLAEFTIETFCPADAPTATLLHDRLCDGADEAGPVPD